ncbi:MAG: 3-ketoacyl-ACP reductase [Spirochaetales bacterium]|jgi:3-oxoacyl-[acyl-carrier protein] reductase|nr:3-ketoacyl-ACP reductase [Spirochaetales bacterium]
MADEKLPLADSAAAATAAAATAAAPVALVTGGGRGIGLGISKALLNEGYDLAFCGVREAKDVESLETLRGMNKDVLYIQADISRPEDRTRLIKAVKEYFGGINLLVNNAGVAPKERNDLLEATEASFDWVLDVNLKGPYFLTQAVANIMTESVSADPQFQGSIIFVTSISSTIPSTNRGEYCISKAGLSMAASLWAARLAENNIPVYEIRPGIIATDMTSGVKEKYDALIEEGLLLQKRWGTTADIGKAVCMLARGDLPYSTGQVIKIDGSITRTVL